MTLPAARRPEPRPLVEPEVTGDSGQPCVGIGCGDTAQCGGPIRRDRLGDTHHSLAPSTAAGVRHDFLLPVADSGAPVADSGATGIARPAEATGTIGEPTLQTGHSRPDRHNGTGLPASGGRLPVGARAAVTSQEQRW